MALTLERLEEVIRTTEGVSWRPAQTTVSGRLSAGGEGTFGLAVSEDELDRLLKLADETQRSFQDINLPRRIDWRSHEGSDWVTAPRDQGTCGACVAFAIVAAVEARARIQREDPTLALALSEANLFFCGEGSSCEKGWFFEPALKYCRSTGLGRAADAPYKGKDTRCEAIKPIIKVSGWEVKAATKARKEALVKGGPVVAGMRVFEDFPFYAGEGVYKHVAGEFRAKHAVCVVGYDDDEKCWIIKNSWGDGWGEAGFARIGYEECGIDKEFVFYDLEIDHPPAGF